MLWVDEAALPPSPFEPSLNNSASLRKWEALIDPRALKEELFEPVQQGTQKSRPSPPLKTSSSNLHNYRPSDAVRCMVWFSRTDLSADARGPPHEDTRCSLLSSSVTHSLTNFKYFLSHSYTCVSHEAGRAWLYASGGLRAKLQAPDLYDRVHRAVLHKGLFPNNLQRLH